MCEPYSAPAPLPERTPGWSLPAAYYTDERIFAAELEAVFGTGWLFAGHSCELTRPGDFLTFTLGSESVLVVRDQTGELRAHHNVCRHRGSRLCDEPRGHVRAFVCPYHQWVYGLDGELRSARLMGADFPTGRYRLGAAPVREVAGLVFVSLAAGRHPSRSSRRPPSLAAQLAPHRLEHARIVARHTYTVAANWKTLVENNRECYHCRGSHPEFLESNFEFGSHGDPRRSETYERVLAEAYARWRPTAWRRTTSASPTGSGSASPGCRCARASAPRRRAVRRWLRRWARSATAPAACG